MKKLVIIIALLSASSSPVYADCYLSIEEIQRAKEALGVKFPYQATPLRGESIKWMKWLDGCLYRILEKKFSRGSYNDDGE